MIAISLSCCLSLAMDTKMTNACTVAHHSRCMKRELRDCMRACHNHADLDLFCERNNFSLVFHYVHLVRINQSSWSQQSTWNWKDFQPDHIIWNILPKLLFIHVKFWCLNSTGMELDVFYTMVIGIFGVWERWCLHHPEGRTKLYITEESERGYMYHLYETKKNT